MTIFDIKNHVSLTSDTVLTVQAQRRSKEHSRSTSALSGMADEKSEVSQDADHHMSLYSNGFMASSIGNDPESPQQTSPNTACCMMCHIGMSVYFTKQFTCVGFSIYTLQCNCNSDTHLWFSCIVLTCAGYQHAKTVELQQRSSSVATQQTTVSSVPSHPSTTGVSNTHSLYTHTLHMPVRKA